MVQVRWNGSRRIQCDVVSFLFNAYDLLCARSARRGRSDHAV